MKHIKSERLKKMEIELKDLEQWLKLGLVPKRDHVKHQIEIDAVRAKINEEKERLQFLRESGDTEEYITPKRNQTRTGYTEMPSIPDVEVSETGGGNITGGGFEIASESTQGGSSVIEEREDGEEASSTGENEDDFYFNKRNRWHRSGILDPDADEW